MEVRKESNGLKNSMVTREELAAKGAGGLTRCASRRGR